MEVTVIIVALQMNTLGVAPNHSVAAVNLAIHSCQHRIAHACSITPVESVNHCHSLHLAVALESFDNIIMVSLLMRAVLIGDAFEK